RQDDVQAMKWYTLAAYHEFGEYVTPTAQEVNAKILAEGRLSDVKFNLTSREVKKAEGLIEDAYESGSPHEIFQLARLYQYGHGVAKDNVKAAQFYQIAAMNGVKSAGPAYDKVKNLLDEKESKQTKAKVVAWQPPLPELHQGDTAQMKKLKALIDELEAEQLNTARERLFDVRDDMQLIQRALKVTGFDPGPIDGKPGPQTRNAINDFQRVNKFPISPDLQDAELVKLFEKAANNGDSYSEYAYGVMFLEGIGVKQHGKNAEKWLKAAKDKDLTEAYYALGVLYRDGLDTPPEGDKKTNIAKSTDKARSNFAQAAYRNYAPARSALDELNAE
ncbi:MAG: peptidoglycan-binding protein, partial [Pseudomonadota bacterium]